MKLYYKKGACSLVVRIILNEVGLDFEAESVDLHTKKTENGQDFYKINPKGSVPALELDKGEILTENAVILQYLADFTKAEQILPAVGNLKRYRVLEWLNYITTELHKGFGALFNPALDKQTKEGVFIPMLQTKFRYINEQLQNKPYLLGEQFTLPDAYVYVMLLWARYHAIDISDLDNLNRYFENLGKRQSIIKSLEQEQ